jgi:Pyruvate/2-oxoacid:ferredoxin oxidoreductase delta subunit
VAASCIACLAACPRSAVRLDGGAPEIVEHDCDACGLCVAACPRGALSLPLLYARGEFAGHVACFAACDNVPEEAPAGRVPCLHAIGLDVLLRALRLGVRLWLVARADCTACERGRGPNLHETVAHLNKALRARGDPGIVLMEADARRWALACALRGAEKRARRQFLGGAIESLVSDAGQGGNAERACFKGTGPVPNAIFMDQSRCVACHACARVCPDGAIRLEENAPAYILEHVACTGCGLCVDVCDRDAVRTSAWSTGEQGILPLRAEVCRECGGIYHAHEHVPDTRCQICAERPARPRQDRIWE